MKSELNLIITSLEQVLSGEPWYGRSVYDIIANVEAGRVYERPGNNPHSQADLLFHMLTWTEFTRDRLLGTPIEDMEAFAKMDWRRIDEHGSGDNAWAHGVEQFRKANDEILSILRNKDEAFLDERVDYREYDFRYLLHGLIDHHVYHTGQLAYLQKTL